MPKQKSRRGAKKRFKVTANGKVLCYRSKKRHLLEGKSASKKRKLRRPAQVAKSDVPRVMQMLAGG